MADHTPQRALRTPSTSTLTLPMPTPSGPSPLTRKMSMDLRRHSFRIPSTSVATSSKVPSSTSLATSSTRSPVKVLSAATRKLVPAKPLSSTTPSTSDLPILRFQYVARNIYVSIGSSWRLPRAERKNIQLTTTAAPEPFLTVFCSATSSSTKFILPADTVVEHSHDQLKLKSSSNSSLRLKLRFATFADAAIWRRLVGDALAQAAWRRDHEEVACLTQDASCRVVVARRVGMKNEYIIKTHVGKRVEGVAEVALLRKLRPLLASLAEYRVVETAQDVQLIMPRHAGKTLLAYLSSQPRKAMDESEARRVVAQMSETLAVLHDHGVVHCDLKLENVLVTDHARDVCVIDFGGAYDKDAPVSKGPTMMVGTPGYIAPERILQVDAVPTPAADVFSLGILLYQMLVGQHPYAKAQAARRRLTMNDSLSLDWAHMERQLCSRHVSREAQELLAQLVAANPSERITLEQVVNHAWFTNQSA